MLLKEIFRSCPRSQLRSVAQTRHAGRELRHQRPVGETDFHQREAGRQVPPVRDARYGRRR